MAKRIEVKTELTAEELHERYRRASDGVERTHWQMLWWLKEGKSAKEVAAVLKISIRTAEAHKARILEALGLRTTAELVQYAIRNGIISV